MNQSETQILTTFIITFINSQPAVFFLKFTAISFNQIKLKNKSNKIRKLRLKDFRIEFHLVKIYNISSKRKSTLPKKTCNEFQIPYLK